MEPRDVFISYSEQDGPTARALAAELRALHLTPWTYEEDGVVGTSYLTQINAAIESCRAFVLLASPNSVNAHQVIREVEQAHEREKVIIATRIGLSHQEFIESNPILRMACGTAVTLAAEDGKLAEVAKRIATAVPAGVTAASTRHERPLAAPPPPPRAPTRLFWGIAAAIVASGGLALVVSTYKAPVNAPEPEASVETPVSRNSTAPNPPSDRGDSKQPEVQNLPEPAKTPAESKKTPGARNTKPPDPAATQVVPERLPDPAAARVTEVPAVTSPSPEEAGRQLLNRASEAVNCLVKNRDDVTARNILLDVFHRGTSIPRSIGGILKMLEDEFKGATEMQQSEIVKRAGRCGEGR
jgi:TIR domain-containing protein